MEGSTLLHFESIQLVALDNAQREKPDENSDYSPKNLTIGSFSTLIMTGNLLSGLEFEPAGIVWFASSKNQTRGSTIHPGLEYIHKTFVSL